MEGYCPVILFVVLPSAWAAPETLAALDSIFLLFTELFCAVSIFPLIIPAAWSILPPIIFLNYSMRLISDVLKLNVIQNSNI